MSCSGRYSGTMTLNGEYLMQHCICDLLGTPLLAYTGDLIGAKLADSDLRRADMRCRILQGASFDGSDLTHADFSGANLYWASFFGTNLMGALFHGSDLRGADLKGARLVGADLSGANLGADNVGSATQLQGANMDRAILSNANLERAEYDETTVMPAGFSPTARGMKLTRSKQERT